MPKKVGVKEIAKKVGCSQATVSQAFNQPRLVSRKTRSQVLAVCEELCYMHRRYSKKRRKIIGVTGISHDLILGEYYNKVTESILSEAKKEGVNVIIESFSDEAEMLPQMFFKKVLDGVLVLGKISQEHVLMIKQQGIPLVLCGHPIPALELHTVLGDGRAGIYKITQHLIELGHKNIAYLTGGPVFDPVTSDRLDGFRYALQEKGIEVPENGVFIGDFCNLKTADHVIDKILGAKNIPTAIICESDALAYTAYGQLIEQKMSIPKDISVTGYDNLSFPIYINAMRPKLTTVQVDLAQLGKTAFEVLLDIIENPTRVACRHTLAADLIIGETTAKLVA